MGVGTVIHGLNQDVTKAIHHAPIKHLLLGLLYPNMKQEIANNNEHLTHGKSSMITELLIQK